MKQVKRYVILRHDRQGQETHWDLMLEHGDCLETYRINKPPEQWGKDPIEAVKIFDHPLKFLTYEGIVNNGKGSVTIADSGTYRLVIRNELQLKIEFSGTILKREIIFAIGGCRVRRG